MKKNNKSFIFVAISMIILFVMVGAAFADPGQWLDTDDSADTSISQSDNIIANEDKPAAEKINDSEEAEEAEEETEKQEEEKEAEKKVEESDKKDAEKSVSSTESSSSKSTSTSTSSTASKSSSTSTQSTATKTETTAPKTESTTSSVEATRGDTSVKLVAGAYFVATSGNDSNPGTQEQPFRTIQKAANTVKAGDTVYIRGGTYNEKVDMQTSGTSGNYITFRNYPGEKPVVDGKGIDWGYNWNSLVNINSKSYIRLEGLRVINSRWAGIGSTKVEANSNYIQVINCSTSNTRASGIAFYTATNITVDGNSVEKACTASGSQEAISFSNVNGFVIRNNRVFNITNSVQGAGGEGIDAKEGSSNGKIYNNTVHDIAKIGIYIDSYSKTSSNIEVYGNNIYNCGQGITVASEKGGTLRNVNIYNNTIRNCRVGYTVAGWDYNYSSPMDNIKFYNNTISGGNIRLNNPDAKRIFITGNRLTGGTIVMDGGIESETTIEGNTIN